MKKMMFIGDNRSAKEAIIAKLSGGVVAPRKIMAIDYYGPYINTPAEFLENSFFYPALITTAAECDLLVFVQSACSSVSLLPPLFASMFSQSVVGVISESEESGAKPDRAELFLKSAGVRRIVTADSTLSIEDLQP